MLMDEQIGRFKDLLDNKKDHRLSKETREELVKIYDEFVKIRNRDTDLKFFDKLRNVNATMDFGYYFEQMKECLESEGVDISIDDLVKTLDIFIRIIGLDRKVTKKEGLFVISSAFHKININTDAISDFEGKKLETVKNAFKKVNDLAENKIENFDNVLSNLKIIYKELAIFMNEAMTVIEGEIISSTDCQTIAYASNKETFVFYGVIDQKYGGIRYMLYSSMLTHKDPKKTILLTNTISNFTEETKN